MTTFFEKRDRWGNRLAMYVLAFLFLLLPVIGYGLTRVHFNNDVRDWLPKGDQDARILAWHDSHFQRYDTFLVSWDDSSLDDPRISRFIDRVQGTPDADGKLVGGLHGVHSVSGPNELLNRMVDAGIPHEEAIHRLEGVLIGSGYLKVRLTDTGRMQRASVEQQLSEFAESTLDVIPRYLAPGSGPLEQGIGSEKDTGIANASASPDVNAAAEQTGVVPPHDFQVGWPGIHPGAKGVDQFITYARTLQHDSRPLIDDCFFALGAPVALYVRLMPGTSREFRKLMPAIQDAAVEVGIDGDAFHMAGTPVGQWQLDVESSKSIWNPAAPVWLLPKRSPFLLSGIVGMVVAFLLLRSLRLASLVLAVSAYSAALTIVLIPMLGPYVGTSGMLNIVLSVMPNLLLVLTASGAIHMANYWRHAAVQQPTTAVSEAFRAGFRPCAMASITTAIGMASLATSGLVPVRDFGLFSAAGTCLSLLIILYGFPSILAVLGGIPKRFRELETGNWRRFGTWVARHYFLCSAVFFAVLATGVWGLRSFHTETKVIRYFPDDARIVRDYNAIEESLAGVVTIDIVVYFDQTSRERMNILERMELVRAVEESLKGAQGVSGALSLADFRPVSEPPGPDASTLQRIAYARKAQRMEREVFGAQSESASQLVTHVRQPLEFVRGGRIGPVAWLRNHMTGTATASLSGGQVVRFSSGSETEVNDNAGESQQARGNEIWRVRAQTEMMSRLNYEDLVKSLDERTAAVLKDHAGVDYVVTGMVPLFLRTQQAVIESLITSFGLAFIVIAITMIVLLRSVSSGLLTMIPNVWPIAVVFGGVSLAGVPIDIGTMITGSIAMGIAIDGTVHLLTWFQQAIREGHTREEAVVWAIGRCGPALWQTNAAISLAMLMLIFTDLLLISRFGWIMSAAVFAGMVADLVLTPALLAGGLGFLVERSVKRRMAVSATECAVLPDADA